MNRDELIMFGTYLTGHDTETVSQMLDDWLNSPKQTNLNRMTRQELELKAEEFDSKLKLHPANSEELQEVLCDFVEFLSLHDIVGKGCGFEIK